MSKIMVRVGVNIDYGNEQIEFDPLDEKQAMRNHYQTLSRLDARGGLSWCEAAAILDCREWRKMDTKAAEARVREIVAERQARSATVTATQDNA